MVREQPSPIRSVRPCSRIGFLVVLSAAVGFVIGWLFHAVSGVSNSINSSLAASFRLTANTPGNNQDDSNIYEELRQTGSSAKEPSMPGSEGRTRANIEKESDPVDEIVAKRPNWRMGYDLRDWVPRWLPEYAVKRWASSRRNETHLRLLYGGPDLTLPATDEEAAKRDEYFWDHISGTTRSWADPSAPFSVGISVTGIGHRLQHLSFSYMCSGVPNGRQLLVDWHVAEFMSDNRMWHALFDDSPVLAGLPPHWSQDRNEIFRKVNEYRKKSGILGSIFLGGLSKGGDRDAGDFNMYFMMGSAGGMCQHWKSPRDLWLLRLAQEPSVQEFYLMLRAQLRQRIKDQIAEFVEQNFPKDKIVVGVHVRGGNGKDSGGPHFDKVQRGEWLKYLPAAVTMVRKHLRMVAYSIMDRYNAGSSGGLDFEKKEFDERMDGAFRIFLATDTPSVLDEFRKQHPNVLTLEQERLPEGTGTANGRSLVCKDGNKSHFECQVHNQESMLMDMFIMSSCDAVVAESFSNFMYTVPASIMMAEGRIFCESGRSALGGPYILGDDHDKPNLLGGARWWEHPPSDVMPVRCHQGGFAARDRFNFSVTSDVPQ